MPGLLDAERGPPVVGRRRPQSGGPVEGLLPVTHPAPEDFTALARLSGPVKGGNHLATVFIDGNALGQFFTALASDSSVSARAKARVSRPSPTPPGKR